MTKRKFYEDYQQLLAEGVIHMEDILPLWIAYNVDGCTEALHCNEPEAFNKICDEILTCYCQVEDDISVEQIITDMEFVFYKSYWSDLIERQETIRKKNLISIKENK